MKETEIPLFFQFYHLIGMFFRGRFLSVDTQKHHTAGMMIGWGIFPEYWKKKWSLMLSKMPKRGGEYIFVVFLWLNHSKQYVNTIDDADMKMLWQKTIPCLEMNASR